MRTLNKKRGSFEDAVIKSFDSFFEAVERGEPISVRKVKLDLEPRRYRPADIKQLRHKMNVSQAIFAQLLAVSVKTIQGWEAGATKAPGLACRLLDEISVDPRNWLQRRIAFHTPPIRNRAR